MFERKKPCTKSCACSGCCPLAGSRLDASLREKKKPCDCSGCVEGKPWCWRVVDDGARRADKSEIRRVHVGTPHAAYYFVSGAGAGSFGVQVAVAWALHRPVVAFYFLLAFAFFAICVSHLLGMSRGYRLRGRELHDEER